MSAAAIFAELSALIQLPPIPRPHSGAAGRDFRQHVVIIGGGFARLASAVALRHAPVRMTLIDRRNYHLSPAAALPGPTTGRSPADIASPIRSILSRKAQCHSNARQGHWDRYPALTEERRVAYDQLVVATRAPPCVFSHEEWQQFAPGLEQFDYATDIRRRLLLAFVRTENSDGRIVDVRVHGRGGLALACKRGARLITGHEA